MKIFGFCLLGILGLFLLYILVVIVSGLLVDTGREYTKDSPYYRFLMDSVTWFIIRICGIRIRTSGLERIPKDTRFVLVGNHRSNFDPIVTWYVLKRSQLAFISKESNFHIFGFGPIVRKCCFLSIDRENPKNAIASINKAADLLKNDTVSIGVYPEGTRSKDAVLLPFHNGVFKIAQKANVPIAVVALRGTQNIHKNVLRRLTPVFLDVVDVIDAKTVKELRTGEIGDRVREDLILSVGENGEKG